MILREKMKNAIFFVKSVIFKKTNFEYVPSEITFNWNFQTRFFEKLQSTFLAYFCPPPTTGLKYKFKCNTDKFTNSIFSEDFRTKTFTKKLCSSFSTHFFQYWDTSYYHVSQYSLYYASFGLGNLSGNVTSGRLLQLVSLTIRDSADVPVLQFQRTGRDTKSWNRGTSGINAMKYTCNQKSRRDGPSYWTVRRAGVRVSTRAWRCLRVILRRINGNYVP